MFISIHEKFYKKNYFDPIICLTKICWSLLNVKTYRAPDDEDRIIECEAHFINL